MYKVTIAIPVYNVESYILKSMESALDQTFDSIEFLVIDDKGTDNSMQIVRNLQNNHPRGTNIRIVDNVRNKGLSETRNVALREATGEFLFYLDSDDFITSNCIETLYNAMLKNNVDVVISSFQEILSDGKVRETFDLPYMVGHQPDELATLRYGKLGKDLLGTVWNVLYRMSFLRDNQVHFKAKHICEDTLFWLDVYPLVGSFVLLPDITYFYLIRANSLTFFNSRKQIPLNEVRERISIRTYAKKKLMEAKGKAYFEDMAVYVMHFSYNAAVYIMKDRKYIFPKFSMSEIKGILSFPLSAHDVWSMKKSRKELLFYYMVSSLPSLIEKLVIFVLCKYYFRKRK